MRYDRPLPVPLRPDLDHAREAAMTLDRPRPGEIAACEKFWTDARAARVRGIQRLCLIRTVTLSRLQLSRLPRGTHELPRPDR